MALKVSVNHPQFPKDSEFGIEGIGRIPNGGSITLTDVEEEAFFARTGTKIRDAFKNNPTIKVEGSSEAKISTGGGEG